MAHYDPSKDADQFPRIRQEIREARVRALIALDEGGTCGCCGVDREYFEDTNSMECPCCKAEQNEYTAFISSGRI